MCGGVVNLDRGLKNKLNWEETPLMMNMSMRDRVAVVLLGTAVAASYLFLKPDDRAEQQTAGLEEVLVEDGIGIGWGVDVETSAGWYDVFFQHTYVGGEITESMLVATALNDAAPIRQLEGARGPDGLEELFLLYGKNDVCGVGMTPDTEIAEGFTLRGCTEDEFAAGSTLYEEISGAWKDF